MAGCCRTAAVAKFRNPMISPFRSRNWSRNSGVNAPAGRIAPQPVAFHPDLDVLACEAGEKVGNLHHVRLIGPPNTFLDAYDGAKWFRVPAPSARRFPVSRCLVLRISARMSCGNNLRSSEHCAAVQRNRLSSSFICMHRKGRMASRALQFRTTTVPMYPGFGTKVRTAQSLSSKEMGCPKPHPKAFEMASSRVQRRRKPSSRSSGPRAV